MRTSDTVIKILVAIAAVAIVTVICIAINM